jgi:hypothetical protein
MSFEQFNNGKDRSRRGDKNIMSYKNDMRVDIVTIRLCPSLEDLNTM